MPGWNFADTWETIAAKLPDAQAQVQGDAVRVSGPSRDELQQVIVALKAEDYGIELKFGNYR